MERLRVRSEPDCLELFERKLAEAGLLTGETIDEIRRAACEEVAAVVEQVMQEPEPGPDDVRTHTYAPSPVDVVYPDDYTGLPQ